jgi:HEPN domain-containing protein
MKPITLEWIEKAEEDWHVMGNAYRARKNPAYNATCFHAQQCAEKYLKGRLAEAGIRFHRTRLDPAFDSDAYCRTGLGYSPA